MRRGSTSEVTREDHIEVRASVLNVLALALLLPLRGDA
jgi:hypothetical protein